MVSARLNPEFKPRAKESLKLARQSVESAESNANGGRILLAGADLIVAGEEVARARILFAAYEDLVTFDPLRASDRLHISEKELGSKHRLKYALLTALTIGQALGLSRIRYRSLPPTEKAKKGGDLENDPNAWVAKNLEGLAALLEFSDRLEVLRMGRYLGVTPSGTTPQELLVSEFDRLAVAIHDQIEMATFEQDVYVRSPGELEALQQSLPGIIRVTRGLLGELTKAGALGKQSGP